MNITIYKNPEGGYEFSGTRSDGQTINGSVDTTQTIEQFKDKIKFWEVPRQIKERVRKTLIDLDCEHLIIEERPAE